ncbi:pentatricopeptide repeat-containing protein At1g71460, chloroplastic [Malania oleifera]|uniref:pentatricopeptide repeat-containing protein At1g71460, chloroplastic n=1 Tax=Malania oleifera TaxID=397392 RepID=UPI0025AE6DC1|nr:pentatricopeptide repeat-containing protein At1g71460, chloroplastic [Malania oleifera]
METASSLPSQSSFLYLTNLTSLPAKTLLKPSPTPHLHNHNNLLNIKASTLSPTVLTQWPPTGHRKPPKLSSKKRQLFAEKDAFPMSLPLHLKNPHSICKDIQRFARQGKLKEALAVLDYMDLQGVPVNATTFSDLIAACVRSKSLAEGRQIHTYIRKNGFESNEFLCTKLVHMYTSCGSIEDAKRVFDGLHCKSVYSWNALLRGSVVSGRRQYSQPLFTFLEMQELGIELNVYTFSCLIKSFAGASALLQGLMTQALLIKNGLMGSSILQTGLVDLYFKCRKVKLACRLFEEISEKDVVLWGAMIAGLEHNRLQRDALECFRCMTGEEIDPNSAILTTILPVIGELCAHKLGREVHAYVLKTKSYSRQLFIQSALIDMYCKCRDLGLGREVFYASRERNAVSWTALMSGYVSDGRCEQALRSVVWMQQEGIKPDAITVVTVLPACAKLRALKQGKEIHGYAVRNGFLPNVTIVTSLMVMYSRCGVLEYSFKLFDDMHARNVISWTAMIDSCIENGKLCEALRIFRLMQLSRHTLDSAAMARMLSVCGQLRVLKLGREIHGHILKKGFESSPFVSAEIMKMYGICQAMDKAKLVFDVITSKGSLTWTAIIEAYGYNSQYQYAISLFFQMISDGFTPSRFTFKVVLSICEQAGLADEACQIFNLMTQGNEIKASEEHYSSVIGLLTRLGRIEEAQRYIQMRLSLS